MTSTDVGAGMSVRASAARPAPVPSRRPFDVQRRAAQVLALAFVLLALWALCSLWVPIILGSWFALIARPAQLWFASRMGGNRRAATLITLLLVVLTLLPFAVVLLSLAGDAVALVEQVAASAGTAEALRTVVSGPTASAGDARSMFEPSSLVDLARRHGVGAFGTLTRVAGAVTTAIIGIVVFVYAFYVLLLRSPEVHRWLRERSPLRPRDFERLSNAYAETGRGLLIGVGLTALLQGGLATVGYVLVDIPHALVLGLLTMLASVLPVLGSGLVWVPVAIALAISGRTGDAAIITGVGFVVGVADNFLRPAFSRYGKLTLPVFLLFVAMLGGIAAFGAWGLVLGPLVVRLAVEALNIFRDQMRREQREPTGVGH